MFKIGEFARLTQVPVRTLHHYDDIGLFTPARVDPHTGYRYYSVTQLPRLNRILALKGLGLALDQIRLVLDADLSANELRGMLRLRRAQLEQQLAEAQSQLAQVDFRLAMITQEGTMSPIEVVTKTVEPVTVVGAREVVSQPEQMRERCLALNAATRELIAAQGLKTEGLGLALYYPRTIEGIDVEMATVIEADAAAQTVQPDAAAGDGAARVYMLPAALVAYAVYHGSYNDFAAVGQVHTALHQWIEAHNYQIAGPSREYYLQVPESFADEGVMEIQYPVVAG